MKDIRIARLEARLERLRSFMVSIRDDVPDVETAKRVARVALANDDRSVEVGR